MQGPKNEIFFALVLNERESIEVASSSIVTQTPPHYSIKAPTSILGLWGLGSIGFRAQSPHGLGDTLGTLFWSPCSKDPTIQGTTFGSPIFGNSHIDPALFGFVLMP